MNPTVSVCITSYNRPNFLRQAVDSCLRQGQPPLEILIGDDSSDDRCLATGRQLMAGDSRVVFVRNTPTIGKSRNIDMLLGRTRGDYVVLLHDDDLLLEDALEHLCRAFEEHPGIGAAFGLQKLIGEDGVEIPAATADLNQTYLRTPERKGLVHSPVGSAISGQFPNDGYMLEGALARSESFHDGGHGAIGGDFRFAWNLARRNQRFYFLDRPISAYRMCSDSMTARGGDRGSYHVARMIFEEVGGSAFDLADPEITRSISRLLKPAIAQAAAVGDWRRGFRWYASQFHRKGILTPAGVRRLGLLLRALWSRSDPGNLAASQQGLSPNRQ